MNSLLNSKTFTSIDVNELDNMDNINIIDIREASEFKKGHIPRAKNIPMNDILNDVKEYLDKESKYYIICQAGIRSARLCTVLYLNGYDVINVSGGTVNYKKFLVK